VAAGDKITVKELENMSVTWTNDTNIEAHETNLKS
jgi:hypothetical protein